MKKLIYTLILMIFAFSLVSCNNSKNNIKDIEKFTSNFTKHHQDKKIGSMFSLSENVYVIEGIKEGKESDYTYTKEFSFIGNISSKKLTPFKSKYFYFEQHTKMTNFKSTKTYAEKLYFINGEIYYQIQSEYENKTYKYDLTSEYFNVYLEGLGGIVETDWLLLYFESPSLCKDKKTIGIYVNDAKLKIEREIVIPEKYTNYDDFYTYKNIENYYYNDELNLEKISLEILKQNKEGTIDLMNSCYSIMLYDKYFDFVVPYFYDNIGSFKPTMIDMNFNSDHFEIFM